MATVYKPIRVKSGEPEKTVRVRPFNIPPSPPSELRPTLKPESPRPTFIPQSTPRPHPTALSQHQTFKPPSPQPLPVPSTLISPSPSPLPTPTPKPSRPVPSSLPLTDEEKQMLAENEPLNGPCIDINQQFKPDLPKNYKLFNTEIESTLDQSKKSDDCFPTPLPTPDPYEEYEKVAETALVQLSADAKKDLDDYLKKNKLTKEQFLQQLYKNYPDPVKNVLDLPQTITGFSSEKDLEDWAKSMKMSKNEAIWTFLFNMEGEKLLKLPEGTGAPLPEWREEFLSNRDNKHIVFKYNDYDVDVFIPRSQGEVIVFFKKNS